jgi:ferritin-like metal-binding protein YciE
MELKDLHSLFLHELRDLYSAEKQLIKALPKMAKAATNDDLRRSFEEHLGQTETQVKRLEEVFSELDASPRGRKCAGMEGLIEEAKELLEEDADPRVLDAALICAAQRVEHYEIAGYGCVRSLAQQLGMSDLAAQLQETLNEEKKSNEKLNKVALGEVNKAASQKKAA